MIYVQRAWLLALPLLFGCEQTGNNRPALPLPPPSFDPPMVRIGSPTATLAREQAPPVPVPARPAHPEWTTRVAARAWRYIVIHHSATARGSAATFDRSHRERGWDGLGYHFVIGNGTNTADGVVEVGPRWTAQQRGAHAGVDLYNEQGIGICLVGDFNTGRPSKMQLESLAELVAYLMRQNGIPAERVLGHRDCKPTDCPGRNLDMGVVRQMAQRVIAVPTAAPRR